ncbi:MAG: cupin domain-containing protein [Chitinophagaceae bacterium]|nr:MAG: cupin domain-containing protein [Chitinophagaceae bacterium]
MAYRGKRISNPVNKQTIEFVTTAKESDGRMLEMISTWQPHSPKPVEHYHPSQEEVFTVLEGELSVKVSGRQYTLSKGESIHLDAATVHSMWNNSATPVVANWKVFPARRTEYLLEAGMTMAAEGKLNQKGVPSLLRGLMLARKYRKEFRLHRPPYIIQGIVFFLLSPLALFNERFSKHNS